MAFAPCTSNIKPKAVVGLRLSLANEGVMCPPLEVKRWCLLISAGCSWLLTNSHLSLMGVLVSRFWHKRAVAQWCFCLASNMSQHSTPSVLDSNTGKSDHLCSGTSSSELICWGCFLFWVMTSLFLSHFPPANKSSYFLICLNIPFSFKPYWSLGTVAHWDGSVISELFFPCKFSLAALFCNSHLNTDCVWREEFKGLGISLSIINVMCSH